MKYFLLFLLFFQASCLEVLYRHPRHYWNNTKNFNSKRYCGSKDFNKYYEKQKIKHGVWVEVDSSGLWRLNNYEKGALTRGLDLCPDSNSLSPSNNLEYNRYDKKTGKKRGTWIEFDSYGGVKYLNYFKGMEDGKCYYFNANGYSSFTSYKKGVLDGCYCRFYKDTIITNVRKYRMGRKCCRGRESGPSF